MIENTPLKRRRRGRTCRYEDMVQDVMSLLEIGDKGRGNFSVWYRIKEGETPSKVRCAIRNAVSRRMSEQDRQRYDVVSSVQQNKSFVVVTLEKK